MDNQENESRITKWLNYSLIVILVAAVLGLIWFLYLNNPKTKETAKTTPPPATAASEAQVSITKDGFVPATIQIKKGSQVTWTNKDSSSHQIASDPHPTHTNLKGLVGDKLAKDESFAFIFEKTGTFTYHDELNPLKFQGTVKVQ